MRIKLTDITNNKTVWERADLVAEIRAAPTTPQPHPQPAEHPQKEYIITEEQVETIHHLFLIPEHSMDDADYMMQEDILTVIRSHATHTTPAPAGEPILSSEPTFDVPFGGDVYVMNGGKSQYLFTIEKGKWGIYDPEHDRAIREDENSETITKIVQELAGTWRIRDQKLFDTIRKYRKVPIGAMKEKSNE